MAPSSRCFQSRFIFFSSSYARFALSSPAPMARTSRVSSVISELWILIEEQPGVELTVDLVSRRVTGPEFEHEFALDDFSRYRLIEGLDDIGLTLRHEPQIAAFEATRPSFKPVVA